METQIILNATPDKLHRVLEVSSPPMSERAFDVVHFIGRGYFDRDNQIGYLIFQDEMGRSQQVDSRSLQEILCRRSRQLRRIGSLGQLLQRKDGWVLGAVRSGQQGEHPMPGGGQVRAARSSRDEGSVTEEENHDRDSTEH